MTMATPIEIEVKETESEGKSDENSINSEEEVSNDPNIDFFLEKIKELKFLAKEQNLLLQKFQLSMNSAKEDCEKIASILTDIENDKKGLSELFGSFDARQSALFEHQSTHRTNESSMFISSLDGVSLERRALRSQGDFQIKLHKPSLTFVKRGLLYSHIFS
jgi:uncharacterized protein (UPF0147 family)